MTTRQLKIAWAVIDILIFPFLLIAIILLFTNISAIDRKITEGHAYGFSINEDFENSFKKVRNLMAVRKIMTAIDSPLEDCRDLSAYFDQWNIQILDKKFDRAILRFNQANRLSEIGVEYFNPDGMGDTQYPDEFKGIALDDNKTSVFEKLVKLARQCEAGARISMPFIVPRHRKIDDRFISLYRNNQKLPKYFDIFFEGPFSINVLTLSFKNNQLVYIGRNRRLIEVP